MAKGSYEVHVNDVPAKYGPTYFPRKFAYKKDAVECAQRAIAEGASFARVECPGMGEIDFRPEKKAEKKPSIVPAHGPTMFKTACVMYDVPAGRHEVGAEFFRMLKFTSCGKHCWELYRKFYSSKDNGILIITEWVEVASGLGEIGVVDAIEQCRKGEEVDLLALGM